MKNSERQPSNKQSFPVSSHRLTARTTEPSADMNWKETVLFQNFPTQQVSASG